MVQLERGGSFDNHSDLVDKRPLTCAQGLEPMGVFLVLDTLRPLLTVTAHTDQSASRRDWRGTVLAPSSA